MPLNLYRDRLLPPDVHDFVDNNFLYLSYWHRTGIRASRKSRFDQVVVTKLYLDMPFDL